MTKESLIELQKIDCNCNDCKWMVRDVESYNVAIQEDKEQQLYFFNLKKDRLIASAKEKVKKDAKRGELALKEATSMKFTYIPQKVNINYGACAVRESDITFIPNTFQLETQECFVHRKD